MDKHEFTGTPLAGLHNNYNNNNKNTTGTAEVQKTILLGTARILRRVLEI